MAALLTMPTPSPPTWSRSPSAVARASTPSDAPASRQRDRWIAALVAAYTFAPDQIKRLARVTYAARLTAYVTSYRHAVTTAGGAIGHDWQPDDATLRKLSAAALAAAQAIAATYQEDLHSAAAAAVDAWLKQQAAAGATSSASVPRDLAHDVQTWANDRAQWKAQQVGQYETGQAAHQATLDAHDDLLAGDWTDESGDPLLDLLSILYVAILPAESSLDECSEFAGNVYRFDDAPQLDFPAHQNCIHACYYLTAADIGDDAASME